MQNETISGAAREHQGSDKFTDPRNLQFLVKYEF